MQNIEIKNYFIKAIDKNELMSKKLKKVCCNYIGLTPVVPGCIAISDFCSLPVVSMGITSSAIGLKNCAITGGIKKCKPII